MGSDVKIARALISVTDKTGVVDFARTLVDDFGVEIISTGGTARAIEDAGVPVTPIEEFTGYPEMMDGRVKTLHPKVHGALLARRDSEQHMQEAAQHGIKLIDLVVVNLYEFEKTVANPEVTFADAIEHIDIGGPSMLRSAAKNAASVTVISDPADYDAVLAEMRETGGCTTLSTRRRLQVKVYQTTAAYDTAISRWLAAQASDVADHLCPSARVSLEKVDDLRYGENPQQKLRSTALPRAVPSRFWATTSAVRRWTAAPPATAVLPATRWKRPSSTRAAALSPSPPQSLTSSSPAIWNLRNKEKLIGKRVPETPAGVSESLKSNSAQKKATAQTCAAAFRIILPL